MRPSSVLAVEGSATITRSARPYMRQLQRARVKERRATKAKEKEKETMGKVQDFFEAKSKGGYGQGGYCQDAGKKTYSLMESNAEDDWEWVCDNGDWKWKQQGVNSVSEKQPRRLCMLEGVYVNAGECPPTKDRDYQLPKRCAKPTAKTNDDTKHDVVMS